MGKTGKKHIVTVNMAWTAFWDVAKWAIPVFVGIFLVMLTIFLVPVIEMRAELRHFREENAILGKTIEKQQHELGELKRRLGSLEDSIDYVYLRQYNRQEWEASH